LRLLDNYVNNNYNKLLEISRKITSDKYPDYEDLLHDILLDLYKKDIELISRLIYKNELEYFIAKMMINQYHSSTSPFFIKYRKHKSFKANLLKMIYENRRDDIYIYNKDFGSDERKNKLKDIEEKLNWIEEKLKKIKWFDAQVFRVYYLEGHSLNTLEAATKINRNTLGKSIRIVKKYLKEELND